MKIYYKIIWTLFFVQLIIIGIIIKTFHVDNMSLTQGTVNAFNDGWVLVREDGTQTEIQKLPYYEGSRANEKIIIRNTVPEEWWGETLYFLSADKTLKVTVDGETIYTFGLKEQRFFGKTPGSVMAFVDIPQDCVRGEIQIEMCSPYENYATYIKEMEIAKRDVAILDFIEQKAFDLISTMLIFIIAVVLLILGVVQKKHIMKLVELNIWGFIF